MNGDFAIETDGLTKVYRSAFRRREVRAVDGLSLRVPRGATFGLLGPNGAGKTTFIKLLLSAARPTAGSALIFGRPCSEPRARRPVGYLPENHRFPTYQTGAGMLDCYAALSGVDRYERRRRIPELLELVGLKDWGDVRLGKYSKGMLQRVGLAQALIHNPTVLVLDEPTIGLDPRQIIEIRTLIRELAGERTVILSTHILPEVQQLCEKVVIINRGHIVIEETLPNLTQTMSLEQVFLSYITKDEPDPQAQATAAEAAS